MPQSATFFAVTGLLLLGCNPPTIEITSPLPDNLERTWTGPEFYANRLMDWSYTNARIESSNSKPMRTLHLLTYYLGERRSSFTMSVQTGNLSHPDTIHANTWSGFLLGAGGKNVDWRISSLVHHWPGDDGGLIVGIDGNRKIIVRTNTSQDAPKGPRANISIGAWPLIEPTRSIGHIPSSSSAEIHVLAVPSENGFNLVVTASDINSGQQWAQSEYTELPEEYFTGNVALVSHDSLSKDHHGHWFDKWQIGGSKFIHDDSRAFGPILSAQYTMSKNTLKMTAQMPPLGDQDSHIVGLELLLQGTWTPSASANVIPDSYTATLRVNDLLADTDTPYRLTYDLRETDGLKRYYYSGTIRKPKIEDQEFVLASLNCQNISRGRNLVWNHSTIWYPHNELTASVIKHDPDLLFFAGDQIYEGGLAGIVRTPTDRAILDYHYHWYRFIWAFRDLMRDRPTVMIPDDHDVYHGNIWGDGGKKAEGPWVPQSDNGGYIMDSRFVNAVHNTQVSHLPDPFDPTPIEQNISVYYTDLVYGDISFAIIAD